MHNFLSRLELHGFKSFASKTQFEIPTRIVGIVGPNGSGKSNIIDAIRWVLGEREARHLRGEVLGSLMFAGTPKKPPASLARVTLTFDNSEKVLPIDSEEITLIRRIDRSGTTQFFLNDAEIKLKDLVSLLAKARLGTRGLTIIGQGQNDLFVRINPSERREMIEEIIGLKEFRLKKKTAERRLERSRINIGTVRAQVDELSPHLRFLRRQRKKWEKRAEIEAQLKELASHYFSSRYHELSHELKALDIHLAEYEKTKEKKEGVVQQLEKEVHNLHSKAGYREELQKVRHELELFHQKHSDIQRALTRLETKIEFQAEASPSVARLIHLIRSFLGEITPVFERDDAVGIKRVVGRWIRSFNKLFKEEGIKQVEAQRIGETKEIQRLQNELNKLDAQIVALRQREDDILKKQEDSNQKFREYVERLENEKNELRTIEQQIQEKMLVKERGQFRMRELENRWQSLGFPIKELEDLPSSDNKKISEEEREKTEITIERFKSQLVAIGEIDAALIEESKEVEERHTFLTREMKDLETASRDLEKIIKDLDERIHNDFKKYFGLVNKEFNNYFRLMFGGGKARLRLSYPSFSKMKNEGEEAVDEIDEEEKELSAGVDINLTLPKKKTTSLDMLSGGERSLVSLAAIFALISVSPPPFLVLDEIDAALDDVNSRRFAELVKEFAEKTQFVIVTHNRTTMEAIDVLYGVTMGDDGVSRILSMKLEEAEKVAEAA